MNMKRLEISRLMDEYQDNEFFPEEGSSAGTQAVKDRVLAQARPGKKRRIPVQAAWPKMPAQFTYMSVGRC